MPEKHQLQKEIDRLRERLKKNQQLLREAGMKAEEMQSLEDSLARVKEAVEKARDRARKKD